MDLLLLSNSTTHGRGYLEHARDAVRSLVPRPGPLAFVPYAMADHDAYTDLVRGAFEPLGVPVVGVHTSSDPRSVVADSRAVFIGGGNSFRLLQGLQRTGLLSAIREAVRGGLPYLGSSAGTNVACPTIRTTNDMPIVEPDSFQALGLVPFQINAHYLDPDPRSTHMGETREQRLTEFLEANDVPVLALREGAWLRVSADRAQLGGTAATRLFQRGHHPSELPSGTDVDVLMQALGSFDS